jgi:hypothetical protein
MNCYLLKEKDFMHTGWAKTYLHAIKAEASSSKVKLIEEMDLSVSVDNEVVIILATNSIWLKEMSRILKQKGYRIITIGPRQAIELSYNEVLCNFQEITSKAIDYCLQYDKKRILLFGVNPPSSGDNQLKFYLTTYFPSLMVTHETFLKDDLIKLEKRIDEFDVILCCNSITAAAVVEKLGSSVIPSKVWVISLLDSPLSVFSNPSVTGFEQDDNELGHQAIKLARLLKKNIDLSTIILKTTPKFHVRESTENLPYKNKIIDDNTSLLKDPTNKSSNFYNDTIIENLFNIENVLSNLEKPDYTIIKKMLKGDTYAQIAEEAFMSENTVKYRIKRMQKLCNVDNRTSLLNLIVKYCPKFIEEND